MFGKQNKKESCLIIYWTGNQFPYLFESIRLIDYFGIRTAAYRKNERNRKTQFYLTLAIISAAMRIATNCFSFHSFAQNEGGMMQVEQKFLIKSAPLNPLFSQTPLR